MSSQTPPQEAARTPFGGSYSEVEDNEFEREMEKNETEDKEGD